MFSLKPPATKYTSLEDVGKFNMIWNISLVLIPIFTFLVVLHLIANDPSWQTSVTAGVVAVFNILVLSYTRKYKVIGILSILLGVIICQASIFIVNDSHLISDTLWCVLIAFFTYFLMGPLIGTIVLLVNLSGLVVFLLNGSAHDVLEKGISIKDVDQNMIYNVYYVALALAFIIYKMQKSNKEVNERYEAEIARNEILLKEIHHRVKNNLQIISSLLKLQSAECSDKQVEEQFDEAINRIRSMALIHEKMYNNNDLSKIDLRAYIIALVEDITSSFRSNGNIEFNINSEIEKIDIKSIVPISLIFNELITNTLKHGFADGISGVINVDIQHVEGKLIFKYMDNGTWKEPIEDSTFGMELIKTLCHQLEGECGREINDGTHYHFKFNADLFFFNEPELV